MSVHVNATSQDWDRDINVDRLRAQLVTLKSHAANSTPILDDDDLETAIDVAAYRLILGESTNGPR